MNVVVIVAAHAHHARAEAQALRIALGGHGADVVPAWSRAARRALGSGAPDAVHAVGASALALVHRFMAPGVRVVYEHVPGEDRRRGARSPERRALRGVQAVLCDSPDQAAALERRLRLASTPVVVGPPAAAPPDGTTRLLAVYETLGARANGDLRLPKPRRRIVRAAVRELRAARLGAARGHLGASLAYARGRLAAARGRPAAAVPLLAAAHRRAPGVEQYALAHAAALRDAGLEPEARAAYAEIAASAQSTTVLAAAGVSLARLGDRDGAGRVERELVERGDAGDATALLRAGESACARGDLRHGRDLAERALAGGADGSTALRTAVRILEQSGELTAALTVAQGAGDTIPGRRLEGSLRAYDPSWTPAVTPVPPPARRPGRVLNLLETSLPQATSGYAHRARTLVRAQRLAGLDPVAATRLGFPANRRRPYAIVESVDGVVHHRRTLPHVTRYTSVPLDEQLRANAEWAVELATAVGPEAVMAGTPHLNGLLALVLREATGIPFAYDVRGFPELTWAVRRGGADAEMMALRRAAETRCMAAADVVTTLSETMRAEIVGRGIPAERVVVTPHAVDVAAWATVERDPAVARRLDLEDRIVVGIVSSLVGYEGVHTLLEAIALARREEPAIAGLVVGDGEALLSLQSLAERLGVAGDVRFTGRVAHGEVPPYYGLIDVFACPRDDHRVCRLVTPLKPFEAMAAGCCLLVSDLPALREVVDDGRAGALVAPGDPPALAAELVALARDPERRRELAAAGRAHVAEHHDLRGLSAALGEALGGLTAGSTRLRSPTDTAAQA